MSERAGPQPAIVGRQEDQAHVGQAVRHQLGGVLQEFVPVLGGGQQVTGAQQELDPFPGALGRRAGGLFPGPQVLAFLFGPLPGGQVDGEA